MRECSTPRRSGATDFEVRLFGLVPLVLAAIFYAPITQAYFFQDDFLHLYEVANHGFPQYVLTPFAGHQLLSWNALFALLFRLLGPEPLGYYGLVWLNHLANAVLLFEVIRWLVGRPRLACLGASLWGIAPIHAGALGWYSVHGHVLATTAVLLILRDLARLGGGAPRARLAPWRWAALSLLAATSFGVGLAAVLVLPVVAFLVVPQASGRCQATRSLALAALGVLLAYTGLHWLAAVLYGAPSPVSLERILDPGWPLVKRALEIAYRLAARGAASLLLGIFHEGLGPREAGLHVTFGAALAALVAALRLAPPPTRRSLLATLGLVFACYGGIAVGRGLLTPIFTLDVLVDAPRYQYLATAALTLALCLGLAALPARLLLPARSRTPLLALGLALHAFLVAWLRPPIDLHEGARQEIEGALGEMRRQIEAAPPGADVFIRNPRWQLISAGPVLERQREAFPTWAAVFTIFFPENEVAGRRIFFVERDAGVLKAARRGLRSAALVVPNRRLRR